MKRRLTLFLTLNTLMLAISNAAFAGDIVPYEYTFGANGTPAKDYYSYVQKQDGSYIRGLEVTPVDLDGDGAITAADQYLGYSSSTHPYGTWNSPFTEGVDGYNYNDAQDYVWDGDQNKNNAYRFQSGPHGGYLTTTHRCRECHAVHRAAGKFKLTRANSRFEACDWCHGVGAGSGFNIQMDNNDIYTTEYNVGHSMGFGIESGKWKAPDDTYPAFTPPFWLGGFSCFDCHSPHANPTRMLGYDVNGQVKGLAWADKGQTTLNYNYNMETRYYSIVNPGHGSVSDPPGHYIMCVDCHKKGYTQFFGVGIWSAGFVTAVPIYQSGSWLLIKNPDRELAEATETLTYYRVADTPETQGALTTTTVMGGQEISDMIFAYTDPLTHEITGGLLHQFDTDAAYPVNKLPIDWNNPMGIAKGTSGSSAYTVRSPLQTRPTHSDVWNISEFCTDCHDGNSGLSTVAVPLFSEDRALRMQTQTSNSAGNGVTGTTSDTTITPNWKGSYDIGYSHSENSRHCGRQMQFNPQDTNVFGPHCRNCHKGSSGCGRCHSKAAYVSAPGTAIYTESIPSAADNARDRLDNNAAYPGAQGQSTYVTTQTATGEINMVFDGSPDAAHTTGALASFMYKVSRTIILNTNWRTSANAIAPTYDASGTITSLGAGSTCNDDGFSWPHRTLGWKLLKDDLFGLDFDGSPIAVGETRTIDPDRASGEGWPPGNPNGPLPVTDYKVHDLDSVCLDCHNPTIWLATSANNYTDNVTTGTITGYTEFGDFFQVQVDTNYFDNNNDELLTRGLP